MGLERTIHQCLPVILKQQRVKKMMQLGLAGNEEEDGSKAQSFQRKIGYGEGFSFTSHNVEFKAKPGASPILFLYNSKDEVVEKFDLSPLDQKGCNDLLLNLGFYKKPNSAADVPSEYLDGPYIPIKQKEHQEDFITARKSDL
ncbi:hypothetical protein RRG08_064280 [Elysia crispata]|uniref:Selenoprotein F/M domain-containing protein n=1 Tax=Elysia crispata TaxID=231223 RepID=A0AAE0YS29_9GAST|nr:hypothetical protein RRG08_064280 [Elysia crispata]